MTRLALAALLAASGVLATAERAYRQGDYEAAAAGYARALAAGDSSAAVRYNLGTALLRLGRHDEARPHLEAAAGDSALAARAAFNAGFADLAPAAAGRVPPDERRPRLERAVTRYRTALRADPSDADAKWNLELAERLLRREASGGGNEDDEDPAGGGGGSEEESTKSSAPRGADPGGAPLTPAEAERILAGAEQRDLAVQRERLKQDQRRIHGVRDW